MDTLGNKQREYTREDQAWRRQIRGQGIGYSYDKIQGGEKRKEGRTGMIYIHRKSLIDVYTTPSSLSFSFLR